MKAFLVRQMLRTPVQGTFSYAVEGIWITGTVWDLSATGWRATTGRPLPIGRETIVFLALRDGERLHHILIESAIVRWADGRHAGWEILRIDAVNQASVATVMEQGNQVDEISEGTPEVNGSDSTLHCQSLIQFLTLSVR